MGKKGLHMTAMTSHLTTSDDGSLFGAGNDRLQRFLSRGRRSPLAGVAVPTLKSPGSDVRTDAPNVVIDLPPLELDVRAGTSPANAPRQLPRATPRVSVVVPTYNEAKNLP